MYETPILIYFENINIETEGDFLIESVTYSNSSLSFLSISSISETKISSKDVVLKNVQIKDWIFKSRHDLITIGPIFTKSEFNIIMNNMTFSNLNFINLANILQVNVQAKNPFVIDSWSFTNIYGGSILLHPATTTSGISKVNLVIRNITVSDNDFATSTLFILNNFSILNVTNWTMRRNSGYLYGTIASILRDDSIAYFSNCNFNNNNGVYGGLFYVVAKSSISLSNWLLFSNFAVDAAIAYIENLGSISIDNWDISYNMAMQSGLIQVTDTISPTIISNSRIYSNLVVSYNTTIKDIQDPNVWINLWFASNGYIKYLIEHKNILNVTVRSKYLIWIARLYSYQYYIRKCQLN